MGHSSAAWLVVVAGEPELAQMMSGGWDNFFQTPWLALWSGGAFFLAVFSFMLLGEGLKRHLADLRPARRPSRWRQALGRLAGAGR